MAKNLKNPISSKNKETFEVGSKETNVVKKLTEHPEQLV